MIDEPDEISSAGGEEWTWLRLPHHELLRVRRQHVVADTALLRRRLRGQFAAATAHLSARSPDGYTLGRLNRTGRRNEYVTSRRTGLTPLLVG